MSERRNMQIGDWVMAALNVLIGAFVGLTVDGLVQLVTTAFWPVAVLIPLLLAGMLLVDTISDWMFSIGVQSDNKPPGDARAPLFLLLSLPAGAVLGVVVSRFGMADTLSTVIF